jgi:beta-xylosidase
MAIGVAVADTPTGPFKDLGHPIVDKRPEGQRHGQQIDVDVFTDPDTGKSYLYWGNGYMAGAALNDDMTSINEATVTLMTPRGGTLEDYAYREAPYVFKRNGTYYFLWSVDDTGAANYHVAYGTSTSPLGPIKVADEPVILIQDPENEIYGTAHNSVLQIPGRDEWYFVYHRINKNYIDKSKAPGIHREVCIDKMEFNADGTIRRTRPTAHGVRAIR